MKKVFYLIVAAALFLSLSSCSVFNQSNVVAASQSLGGLNTSMWTGKSRNAIMVRFGVPDREVSDGADGVILVYEDIETVIKTTTSENTHFGMFDTDYETKGKTTTTRRFAEFFINAENHCYNVRSNLTQWQFDNPEKRPWN